MTMSRRKAPGRLEMYAAYASFTVVSVVTAIVMLR